MNKIFPLLIAFATLPVLRAAEPKSDANWKKLADLYAKMEDVKVISGNELEIAGIRCRLFGIQIPEDERKVAAAKRFLEHYVDNYRPYLTIYNAEWPINAKNDVAIDLAERKRQRWLGTRDTRSSRTRDSQLRGIRDLYVQYANETIRRIQLSLDEVLEGCRGQLQTRCGAKRKFSVA